ncbi:MAG: TauD/TfdA family dioxygenase [Alphaproteobacteria bacterium]|nr:TauD/TfdA family dioxygenase [Alphaproteobacteria bacterium]
MAMQVRRIGAALGAEVRSIDLAQPLDAATRKAVWQAFMEHQVLVFRDQKLTPAQEAAFAQQYGPPTRHILEGFEHPEQRDVFYISNKKKEGKPVGAIYAGQYWHTDLAYMADPCVASMLYAIEIPSVGGDTLFASTYRGFEALSDGLKALLEPMVAVHDYSHIYATFFRRFPDRPPLTPEQRAKVPPVEHPAVFAHPETGRKVLYVNRGFTTHFKEMTAEESRPLLDVLCDSIERNEHIYRHVWRIGDVVMWDNRCTQHRAIADYAMTEPRHMWRTTIGGHFFG